MENRLEESKMQIVEKSNICGNKSYEDERRELSRVSHHSGPLREAIYIILAHFSSFVISRYS